MGKNKTDAVEILKHRYVEGDPEMQSLIEEERANQSVACQIFDLRSEAGITQRELAQKIGTTASVICRLEDADYDGHSLAMLRRIADALGRKVVITFPVCVQEDTRINAES